MTPMTTWSANDDGTVSDEEVPYYRARVKDIGLVTTGCVHVQPNGVGFTGEFIAILEDDDCWEPLRLEYALSCSDRADLITSNQWETW